MPTYGKRGNSCWKGGLPIDDQLAGFKEGRLGLPPCHGRRWNGDHDRRTDHRQGAFPGAPCYGVCTQCPYHWWNSVVYPVVPQALATQ